MFKTVLSVILNAWRKRPYGQDLQAQIQTAQINSNIADIVVKSFSRWLGQEKKYDSQVPPHFFPYWTYPTLFRLGRKLPLHKVLNQGCKLIVNDSLPINSPIHSNVEIYDIKDFPQKLRINQRITCSTPGCSSAIIAEIYAVILKNPKKILKEKSSSHTIKLPNYNKVGSLKISKSMARDYAIISGDINPIHLSNTLAKVMGLKKSILHGFALFSLVYELLENKGIKIHQIDVRFLMPVYIDTNVDIYIHHVSESKMQIKVVSEDNLSLHMSGELEIKKPAQTEQAPPKP